MAPKLPIDPKRAFEEFKKARDLALASAKDPRGTTEKVVEQTRGAVSLGRHLVEGLAGQVREQVDRRRGAGHPTTDAPRAETPPPPAAPAPAARKAPATKAATKTAPKTAATKVPSPADVAKKAPAKKAPAKKTTKAAAKKAPAKKTAPGDKLPPRAAAAASTPPPPPREIEPNPEADPPRGEG